MNAVIVDAGKRMVYVATDVGVFQSATSAPAWTEVGPAPNAVGDTGFLPDVAVTALAQFNSGGAKLLRASTYGRGVWQFNLLPDFAISVTGATLTVFPGITATFNGTVTSENGFNNSVELSCTAGSTSAPSPCIPTPVSLTPSATGTPFTLAAGTSTVGNYNFSVQAAGSDPNSTTHSAALTLQVVNYVLSTPAPALVTVPRGTTSPAVSFQVTGQGSFNQSVTLTCSFIPSITGATCGFSPNAVVNPTSASPANMTATVFVPAGTTTGNYTVTLQATTEGAPAPLSSIFTLAVTTNPDFVLSELNPFPNVKAGSTGTSGPITISSQDSFSGTVSLTCVTTFGANSCSVTPATVSSFPVTVTLVINGTSFTTGNYQIAVQGISGSVTNSVSVPFAVGDFSMAGPQTLLAAPGGNVVANLTFASLTSYNGQVNAICNALALSGAQCTLNPLNPITIGSGATVPVNASINIPNTAIPGTYNITTQCAGCRRGAQPLADNSPHGE